MLPHFVQLVERIFVGKNKQVDMLSRKKTPVYNQTLYILRQGYFWWNLLKPGWKAYYSKGGVMLLSSNELNAMMRWLPIYRDAIPTCAMTTIQRAHNAWQSWRISMKHLTRARFRGTRRLC